MIVLGLIVFDIPSLPGNMFNQNTLDVAISVTIWDGKRVNGTVFHIALVHSLIVRMHLSTSGMCSPSVARFRWIPFSFGSSLSGLNSRLALHLVTVNCRAAHTCLTRRMDNSTCPCVWLGRNSTVPNLMSCDVITRNASLLTNMMSLGSVTFLYHCITSGASNTILCSTPGLDLFTVFPFREPRFGPNMSCAANRSVVVAGQFSSSLFPTICW